MRCLLVCFLLIGAASPCAGADETSYLLAPQLTKGDTTAVKVTLEVGGEMLLTDETGEQKLPMTVQGELVYLEQLLTWDADPAAPARSMREYETATAKIQIEKGGLQRTLPTEKQAVVAEVREGRPALACTKSPLTRDQFDLVNVVGNSLVLDRLLPGRELSEGENWDHQSATIGALLGMDNVSFCEVTSVVTGCVNQQVQIRLAGTAHGTIDGAPTEMQLRGAYLFHQRHHRITKFNLAIKESRTTSQVVPGLDVVAKISVTVSPTTKTLTPNEFSDSADPLPNELSYDAPKLGYRFLHDSAWYVIAEQSDRISLRALHNGNQTAHCSLSTLPSRGKGRETSLEEFEADVRKMLGRHLKSVTASTNWVTRQGHDCLGVVAEGEIEGVPIEWRYYLIASPDLPRVSLSVTVEQSQIEQFNDADRQIVESLELLKAQATSTASNSSKQTAR